MAETQVVPKKQTEQEERAQTHDTAHKAKVHPLDPDFLVFALPIALLADGLDMITEVFTFLIVPKIIGVAIDFIALVLLGAWMYVRLGRVMRSKRSQQVPGAQLPQAVAKGPLKKVLTRTGLTFLVEALPLFIGILPFWTASVVFTLREK